jgi:hypothetical protein
MYIYTHIHPNAIYVHIQINFKKLAYGIVETSKSKMCRVGRLETQGRVGVEGSLEAEFFLPQGRSVYFLLRTSTD